MLIYIIGERYIDVVLETIKNKIVHKPDFKLKYHEFEDFVFRKIHSIGLFHLVIPAPEQIPMKLIMDKKDYMRKKFAELSEETKNHIRTDEATNILSEISKLKSIDPEVNEIIKSAEESLAIVANKTM